ncbi:hypothetical protein SPFL3102_03564 [Sporomusaceae bacterium FL31]|nr:hypothetical protein SPFL3101_00441 [Sporomusaceae bacterium FL31]GCE35713.1 hypothetical protein SPFL3102_03564 [Sporomusaceae bacterium]
MKMIFSVESLKTIENGAALITEGVQNVIDVTRKATIKIENAAFKVTNSVQDAIWKAMRNLSLGMSRQRYNLIKLRFRARRKYFTTMQQIAEHQAAARHERLAYIVLEKSRLETEAELCKAVAEEYSYKVN